MEFKSGANPDQTLPLPQNVLVVTGIAKPDYLIDHLNSSISKSSERSTIKLKAFADHHKYSEGDLNEIASIFDTFASAEKGILTTEKDWVKLGPLLANHPSLPHWIIAPIQFQMEKEDTFIASLNHKISELPNSRTNERLR